MTWVSFCNALKNLKEQRCLSTADWLHVISQEAQLLWVRFYSYKMEIYNLESFNSPNWFERLRGKCIEFWVWA
jgi:hypothetical protein